MTTISAILSIAFLVTCDDFANISRVCVVGLASRGRRLRWQRFHLSGIEIPDGGHRIRRLIQYQHQQVSADKFRLFLSLGARQVQADQRSRRGPVVSQAHPRGHHYRLSVTLIVLAITRF